MTKEPHELAPTSTDEEQVPELLKVTPEEQGEKVSRRVHLQAESYSGPVMPPHYAEHYETIVPGAADRILAMSEKEQQHRMWKEEKSLEQQGKALDAEISDSNAEHKSRKFGMCCAFILMVLFLFAGCVMAFLGHEIFGGAIISMAGLGSIIGHFVTKK